MENLEKACIDYLKAMSKFVVTKCQELDGERILLKSFTSDAALEETIDSINNFETMMTALQNRTNLLESTAMLDGKVSIMNELVESTAEFHHALALYFTEDCDLN